MNAAFVDLALLEVPLALACAGMSIAGIVFFVIGYLKGSAEAEQ